MGRPVYRFPELNGSFALGVHKKTTKGFFLLFIVYSSKTLILPAFQPVNPETLARPAFQP
jgi:hypothetical protein